MTKLLEGYVRTYEGVTVEYTQTIPTSKQMPEFYVWQEGYESYATITYLDRVVEIERGGEMHLTIPNIVNGQLSDEYADIIRYSDDLEAAGINDDIQLTQFIKTVSDSGFEVYRMNPWWEVFAHNEDMGEIYETFYEAVDAGIDHILDDRGLGLMDEAVNRFIKHTVANLEAALEKQEDQLTLAVLVNLEGVIDSYIEALEYSLDNPPEN